jgi:6-phosphogluconolactonase
VPPDHADSNYRMAREALLDHVTIPPHNIHRIHGELPPRRAADLYQSVLQSVLGVPPRFDLVLLGMGDDGHTASLFPGSSALQESERSSVDVHVPHLDSTRVTLTLPILNRAHRVLFLVSGQSKAPALARIRAGDRLPAARIRPTGGTLLWLVDQAAAADL